MYHLNVIFITCITLKTKVGIIILLPSVGTGEENRPPYALFARMKIELVQCLKGQFCDIKKKQANPLIIIRYKFLICKVMLSSSWQTNQEEAEEYTKLFLHCT